MGEIVFHDSKKQGWLSYVRHPANLAKRIPFTLTFITAVLISGLITQTIAREAFPDIMQRFGWDLNALKEGRLYTLWVGLLFSSQVGHFYSLLGIGVVGVGALEFMRGSKWAATGFLVIGPMSSIITTLSLWAAMNLGVNGLGEYLTTPDMGASVSSFVCWGLFITTLKGRWRWILLIGTALALGLFQIFYHAIWNIDHSVAYVIGLVIGFLKIYIKKDAKKIVK
jgi:phosphatidylglycerol lysyltransferase